MRRLVFGVSLLALACLLATTAVASNQALLILKSNQRTDTDNTISELEAAGCHAQHILPPRSIIAEVPADAEATVRALPNIAAFYRGQAPEYTIPSGANAADYIDIACGIQAWNTILAPPPMNAQKLGSPLVNDNVDTVPETPKPFSAMATSHLPDSTELSEFMAGKVACGIILPESDGSGENWTPSRQQTVVGKIVDGMNWWVSLANNRARLTFVYDYKLGIPTQYEPIQYNESYKNDWLCDMFSHMGYTSGNYSARARAYDNDIRAANKADWGFCFVVADSLNDTDGRYPNSSFAWRETNIIFMTWDNDGWGIDRMNLIASHETGHMFGACDEYYQAGWTECSTGWYCGYLNVQNGNCEYNNPGSVSCKMKNNDASGICSWTAGQIGWTDSNSNNLVDVIDRPINITMSTHVTPTNAQKLTYTGSADITPCPSPTHSEANYVTINKISAVRYKVDSGLWYMATPGDGAWYDSDVEDYTFTTPTLTPGAHTIYAQAWDNFNAVSPIVSQTIVITSPDNTSPIMGPVVDDGDVTFDSTQLHATWSATDPESGVTEYQYAIGTTPADPGSGYVRGWTSTGTTTSVTATGLSLAGGQTYYFYVKAANGSLTWSSAAASDGIRVDVLDIARAKSLAGNSQVTLRDKLVTGIFSGRFYIQEPGNYSAIEVAWTGTAPAIGDKVTVKGPIGAADSSHLYQRLLEATSVDITSRANPLPEPVFMLTRAVGGSSLNAYTPGVVSGSGKTAVWGVGPNSIGLLVRITGKVTYRSGSQYYIDDGCGLLPSAGKKGVRVESSVLVNLGDIVTCTGVVGGYVLSSNTASTPVIKTRDAADTVKRP